MEYKIKGSWSIEGLFDGAVYDQNGKKFGTVKRVIMGNDDLGMYKYKIHFKGSLNKELHARKFKDWLKQHKNNSYKYFTKMIKDYIDHNPKDRLNLE